MRRWLAALVVLVLGRGRRKPRLGAERERIVRPDFPNARAEGFVAAALIAAAICAAAFVAVYAIDSIPRQTQFLGLSLGLGFLFLAVACVALATRVIDDEDEEEYKPPANPEEQEEVEQIFAETGQRFTRRKLLWTAGGAAGAAFGVALLAPVASLGPVFHTGSLYTTPWRRGRRLVDEVGRVFHVDDIEEGVMYTAFPQHADREQMGAPLVVVRLKPAQLQLPSDRNSWAPDGILAYSKICTHAGCAISLYRKPTFAVVEPRAAFVCPCHYSTFDPAKAGKVIFGPAGRDLPQLPLAVGPRGELVAAGNFSGPVGPSWWGVRLHGARS
ncbi:MAG: Rieske 2Fe-2S domain-containing protein [Actinobacteria bacterium]|nr:MAG: Rieske 2Fe-2S domain-containing protein [Actinomycetota bacterium]